MNGIDLAQKGTNGNKVDKKNNQLVFLSGVLVVLWWALDGLVVGKHWENSGQEVGKEWAKV